ncbi:hypothetical protein ACWC0C_26910 [Streptomyces sp. NPDC001709]
MPVLPGGAPASGGAYVLLPREALDGASDLTVSVRVKWGGDKAPWQRILDLGAALGPEQFAGAVGNEPTLQQLAQVPFETRTTGAAPSLPVTVRPSSSDGYDRGTFPGVPLRSRYAPLTDRITVAPYARPRAPLG